jgi:hypothetical protein
MANHEAYKQVRSTGGLFLCQVSPAEAKAVWDGMERPSISAVVRHFKEKENKTVTHATVAKWFKNGWVRNPAGKKFNNPLKQIEKLMPVMLGKTPAEMYSAYSKANGLEDFLDIHQTVAKAQLDLANFVRCLVAVDTAILPMMAKTDPEGMSSLIKATASIAQLMHAVYGKHVDADRKTVDVVRDDQSDDLKEALSAWEGASKKK